ncbi:hypothetical protein CpipJ_CPIJ017043 [Culex quinquefasciatus]|uniref:Uncharacterized protein n=1 Tax=Culex quinquefasciatus TaxID=7176 RepID=B0XBU6_CULQU|nr:hypothetical protein CpipJ_CPIJ017043 [Culex quinquefasciatus]|eukprot:XP_001867118.1 hypothetical protein CpipJ_CPIJ017043 [Culex quinquefasciatus]
MVANKFVKVALLLILIIASAEAVPVLCVAKFALHLEHLIATIVRYERSSNKQCVSFAGTVAKDVVKLVNDLRSCMSV